MFDQPICLFQNTDTLLNVGYFLLAVLSVTPMGVLGWKLASYLLGEKV